MVNIYQRLWEKITAQPRTEADKTRPRPITHKERPLISAQEIAIRKRKALVLPKVDTGDDETKMQLQLEAMNIGFIFTEPTLNALASSIDMRVEIYSTLKKLVGADKTWEPMYPNFPAQIYSESETRLFFNAIAHYLTFGTWKPDYIKEARHPLTADLKYESIDIISISEYFDIFNELLTANASLSETDRNIIHSFMHTHSEEDLRKFTPELIPFKETRCQLIAEGLITKKEHFSNLKINTSTDLLRIASYLAHGDISLSENTRFRLSRPHRKWIVSHLEPVINPDDILRHKEKWKRLFHCLHIGSFEHARKSREIASQLRSGSLIGFNGHIERAIETRSLEELVTKLSTKPGEFARRMDHLLRAFDENKAHDLLQEFTKVATKVDTRVLIQMLGHFRYRKAHQGSARMHGSHSNEMIRVAIPKGQIANVKVLKGLMPYIAPQILDSLEDLLVNTLMNRFAALPALGSVWIDPELRKSPVPLQMRAASEGLKVIQRGSRIPMKGGDILRFFVHWTGDDIDLSACFLTKDLKFHSEIAYYNLRSRNQERGYNAVHSGDITFAPAPDGACEFIDIELGSITDSTIRYIAMDVRVYEGGCFPAQQANAGWMLRDEMGQAGEIFDARTIEQRIFIGAASYSCIVAIFDIIDMEVIWLDLTGSSRRLNTGNNVANNRFNIEDLLEASINFHQLSIYDLLKLHAESRGSLTSTKSTADVEFGTELVFQCNRVNSEFLA